MAKYKRRRKQKKNPPHQIMKSKKPGKKIKWLQIAAIAIGVIIVLSMVLSLVIIPGSGLSF